MVWSLSLCLGAFGLCGHQELATNEVNLECVLQEFLLLHTPAELNHAESCDGIARCPQLFQEPKSKMPHVYNCLKDIKALIHTQNIKILHS